MKQGHVLVLGSVNTDLVLRCATLPVGGQTVQGSDFRRLPGGKGANQAVAAARMGAAVRFIGAVGSDEAGRDARANLSAEGIDVRHLKAVTDVATGTAMILVDESSGQNCIALYEGANAHVDIELVDSAAADIASAALLVCQLETPQAATLHAARIARDAGVTVLLNPAPAVPLDAELLELVDILVPNESEAMVLAGQAASDRFDHDRVLDALHMTGVRAVLVTLGAQGVMYSDGATQRRYQAYAAHAVDTSGAGDAFIGAFVAALVSGSPVERAIDFAQRAASISVTRHGAMASLPFKHELD
ncbi:ribokinase [Paraburkholderia fungorum]|uniref:ribokinase n=1 Tax=Paraburkholderia fungorum TaxID=134537 RepID=UPI0038BA0B5E